MSRRKVREKVVQALYEREFHPEREQRENDFNGWKNSLSEGDREFFAELMAGVTGNQERLDKMITGLLKGWSFERLSYVDRAILRLGAYELCYRDDIPPNVTLNEAVELAKRFSGDEAARYINGVLNEVRKLAEDRLS